MVIPQRFNFHSRQNSWEWTYIYSKIYNLWEREANSEELTKINSDFLNQFTVYVKKLNSKKNKTKNQLVSTIIDRELSNVSYMIEDFLKLRLQKFLKMVMNGNSPSQNNLCLEEVELVSSINDTLGNYLENLQRILKGETPQQPTQNSLTGDYFVVRFLKDVPQIMGSDLQKYGPFSVEDIATLPKEHVDTLLDHQAVALIKNNK